MKNPDRQANGGADGRRPGGPIKMPVQKHAERNRNSHFDANRGVGQVTANFSVMRWLHLRHLTADGPPAGSIHKRWYSVNKGAKVNLRVPTFTMSTPSRLGQAD
jgi:hypothetical protein